MNDIRVLHAYLTKKRTDVFRSLQNQFSMKNWMDLAETTLLSIQLFNRRRPGEVERILIQDFKCYQGLKSYRKSMFVSQ